MRWHRRRRNVPGSVIQVAGELVERCVSALKQRRSRYLRKPSKSSLRIVEGGGMAIGWFDDTEYDDCVIELQLGDRLYLYSDGVPEAMDAALEQFTMKQMLEIIELGQAQSLDDSVSLLLKSVKRWCAKNGPKDDVSILGLEVCSEN
jgi:sigma-B regulation protein RsbU (phosphoserine phosphatase)